MKPMIMILMAVFTFKTLAQAAFPTEASLPKAPPTAPPIVHRSVKESQAQAATLGTTLYSIGQPTDEEQLYLEYVNRMRSNPAGEGILLATTTDPGVLSAYANFSVDLSLMKQQFSTNAAVPPLAMNGMLVNAARWHSGNMFTNMYQDHSQTNGAVVMAPWDRMTIMGYNWTSAGENIFSYSTGVFYGHAGFAVDWGYGTGGMQTPAGHRQNMLSPGFREVGMGVYDGVNGSVGPQLITQDFGTASSTKPFITGVVYYDFNGNGVYDVGEGIGGIAVTTPGSSYSAVTADSGGYTIPVTSNGNYTVTFSGSLLNTQKLVVVSGLKNVKVDFLPLYLPPVVSGSLTPYAAQTNSYTFTAVGAATSYRWQQTQLATYGVLEGAENGLADFTVVSSAGYSVVTNDVKYAGSYSYHLAHPGAVNQFLTLNALLRPGAGSQLTFYKRLGLSTTNQVAKAQVSSDGGVTWTDIWSQAGTNGNGETSFTAKTVSLAAYVGVNIQLRFAYLFSGGSYYPQTTGGCGLYLDNIAVTSASQVMNPVVGSIPTGNAFGFAPATNGAYLLQVQAVINSRILNWGPALTVTATSAPPVIAFSSNPILTNGQIQVVFSVASYRSNMTFQVWKASEVNGAWTQDTTATLQAVVAGQKFKFSMATTNAARMFYRIYGM